MPRHARCDAQAKMALLSSSKRMRVAVILAIVVAGLSGLYALVGFVVVPGVLERQLPGYSEQHFGSRITCRNVTFNPFLLKLTAEDVRVPGPGPEPIAHVRKLLVDLGWGGLFSRMWRFDAVEVTGLELNVVRAPDGRLNLARLIEHTRRNAAQRPASRPNTEIQLPRVRIDRAALQRSAVRFIDRSLEPEARSDVTWIDFDLFDISTAPQADGQSRLTAVLPEGGAIAWVARLSINPIASAGEVRLIDAQPLALWKHLRDHMPLAAPAGQIDFAAQYRFAYDKGKASLSLQHASVVARGLVLAERDTQTPALKLTRLSTQEASFDLATRQVVLPQVSLHAGAVNVAVDEHGVMNWQRMFRRENSPRSTQETPWQVRIGSAALDDIDVRYVDASRRIPLRIEGDGLSGQLQLGISAGGKPTQIVAQSIALDAQSLFVGPAGDSARAALQAAPVQVRDGSFDLDDRVLELPGTRLHQGELLFAVDRNGQLNWTGLFAHAPSAAPSAPGGGPGWRFAFPDLQATRLATQYQDDSKVRPVRARVEALGGRLDLAIAPGTRSPVQLNDMRLNGKQIRVGSEQAAALMLDGAELANGRLGEHEVALNGLHLHDGQLRVERDAKGATNWSQMMRGRQTADKPGMPWRIELPSLAVERVALRYADRSRRTPLAINVASLNGKGRVRVVTGSPSGPEADHIALSASGVKIEALADEVSPVALQRVSLEQGRLHGQAIELPKLDINGGKVHAVRAADGTIDVQQLFVDRNASSGTQSQPKGTEAWRVHANNVQLHDIGLQLVDQAHATPLSLEAATVNAQMALDFVAGKRFAVREVGIEAGPLRLKPAQQGERFLSLDRMGITGGQLDTGARLLAARSIQLRGGGAQLERNSSGQFLMLNAFARPSTTASGSLLKDEAKAAPWHYRIGELTVQDFTTRYVDRTFSPPLTLPASIRSAELNNFDSTSAQPAKFDVQLGVGQRGEATFLGTLAQDAHAAQARFNLKTFDLTSLQPVLGEHLALNLKSGLLSANSTLQLSRTPKSGTVVHTDGQLEVADLLIDESITGDRFMSWKKLHAAPVVFDSSAKALQVGRVLLDAPTAKLEITQQGTLNLKRILKAERTAASEQSPAPGSDGKKEEKEGKEQKGRKLSVRVDRLRVRNGNLRYADQSLVLPFAANIKPLNGAMISISNMPGEYTELQAEGRIDPFAFARASGRIDLFDPRGYTNIRAQFKNVEMPKLSPYTITFAGRAVAAGKLWLDLNYQIVNGQLVGNNSVTVQDLKLGERVEAPRARDLPLDLAARLLTNQEGVISVSIPVRGNLNNPSFDYRTVIRDALTTTLTRIATAPFRWLGRLVGLGAEEVDRVTFEVGNHILRPPQQEDLLHVAHSLTERSRLYASVRGTFAAEQDVEAMREERVRRELARRLGFQLLPGEEPGPTAFGQVATQRSLEGMLEARLGPGAVQAFAQEYSQTTRQPVQRVDRTGPALGAGSPDRSFYQAIFRRLVALQPIGEDQARALATQRANTIKAFLVDSGHVAPNRVVIEHVRQVQPTDEGEAVQSEVRLKSGREPASETAER